MVLAGIGVVEGKLAGRGGCSAARASVAKQDLPVGATDDAYETTCFRLR